MLKRKSNLILFCNLFNELHWHPVRRQWWRLTKFERRWSYTGCMRFRCGVTAGRSLSEKPEGTGSQTETEGPYDWPVLSLSCRNHVSLCPPLRGLAFPRRVSNPESVEDGWSPGPDWWSQGWTSGGWKITSWPKLYFIPELYGGKTPLAIFPWDGAE